MNNLIFYSYQNRDFLFGKSLFLGRENKSSVSELLIYPNPAQTEITIQSPTKIQTIEISNGLGQIVSKSILNSKKSNLSISSLPKGIYFVKILLEDNTIQIKKLIIQ